jgi:3-oxoacyl-[acyl-carrier protein] reductase
MAHPAGHIGTYPSKPVLETTQADFYKCIDLNLLSIFHSVHTVLPLLRTAAGEGTNSSMVNIASTGGIRARPGLTWYSASKAACITATQTLSQEFAAEQVVGDTGLHAIRRRSSSLTVGTFMNQRINCVCPVLGNTPLRDAFIGQASADEYRKSIPLGRFAEPEGE